MKWLKLKFARLIQFIVHSVRSPMWAVLLFAASQLLILNPPAAAASDEDIELELEDELEDGLGDELEDELEEDLEDELEEELEDELEEELEDELEEELEDELEEELEDELEEELEDELEEELEDELEEELEDELEEELEGELEDELEGELEDELEGEFEDEFELEMEEEFEDEFELEMEEEFEDDFEGDYDAEFENQLEADFERIVEAQVEDIEHLTANLEDNLGNEIWTEAWLIFSDEAMEQQLQQMGYRIVKRELMASFGMNLTTVLAPASFSIEQDQEIVRQQLQSVTELADLNHIYHLQSPPSARQKPLGFKPNHLMKMPTVNNAQIKLGLIDTAVQTQHPALAKAKIIEKSFVQTSQPQPKEHGTQIAGILVAQGHEYQGLLPNSQLYAASVFFSKQKVISGKRQLVSISTTEALIKALNWLAASDVGVINMSLTGPANRLLAFAVERLCQKNIAIVAAVGNAGPLSKPLYPAGYPCTTAVTAVDVDQQIYRRAVIGGHVDVAAYGVNLQTLSADGGIKSANGTSLATAFASAYLAADYLQRPPQQNLESWLSGIYQQCTDLGSAGFDNIYGFGLLPLLASKRQSKQ